MTPGSTVATRMPCGAIWLASGLLRAVLDAQD
jgi:hypothetical protein